MPRSVGRVGLDFVGTLPAVPEAGFSAPIATNVYVNGAPVVVVDTPIIPHGKGIHNNPANMMAIGDVTVRVGPSSLPLCATGDLALCGHVLLSTSNVFVK